VVGTGEGVPVVRYWIFNYEPQWEAVSKEIDSLVLGMGDGAAACEIGVSDGAGP
jgi:hypothetical protein